MAALPLLMFQARLELLALEHALGHYKTSETKWASLLPKYSSIFLVTWRLEEYFDAWLYFSERRWAKHWTVFQTSVVKRTGQYKAFKNCLAIDNTWLDFPGKICCLCHYCRTIINNSNIWKCQILTDHFSEIILHVAERCVLWSW